MTLMLEKPNVLDQATALRALADRHPRARAREEAVKRANVIAVTSGKGGVGKSNIAVNLAIQFAAAGKRTVLLDADLGLANADVLCNLDLPFNLAHVIGRRKRLNDVKVKAPGGFYLIGGASGLSRVADLGEPDRRRLTEALAELQRQADVVVIDTGAGINANVLNFIRAADRVLVVTTPEPTAVTDAYAVIKVLSREDPGRTASLLVNQVHSPAEARMVYERVAKVTRQFLGATLLDAGCIPADEQVSQSVRKRVPFALAAPKCQASRAVAQLAMRLESGVKTAQAGGFWGRMRRWFKD